MITIKNTQRSVDLDIPAINSIAHQILSITGYPDFDLGIWFTTDATIRQYNKTYRNKDKATDILSFAFHHDIKAGKKIIPLQDDDKNIGDLILSASYVQKQAQIHKVPLTHHIAMLLTHGVCHLLGYDHEDDNDFKKMRAEEARILKKVTALQMNIPEVK